MIQGPEFGDRGCCRQSVFPILGTFELCLHWFLFLFFREDSPSVGQVGVQVQDIGNTLGSGHR